MAGFEYAHDLLPAGIVVIPFLLMAGGAVWALISKRDDRFDI